MPLQIADYVRKPFAVQAVEVTRENIREVAEWCGGTVKESNLTKTGGREGEQQYIKVPVKKPLNDRQTRAYYGDWVLLPREGQGLDGFKVYTPKAFTGSFDEQAKDMLETVGRMEARAAAEEKVVESDGLDDLVRINGH